MNKKLQSKGNWRKVGKVKISYLGKFSPGACRRLHALWRKMSIRRTSINRLRSLSPFVIWQSMNRSSAAVDIHPNRNNAAKNPHRCWIRNSVTAIFWACRAKMAALADWLILLSSPPPNWDFVVSNELRLIYPVIDLPITLYVNQSNNHRTMKVKTAP